MKNIKLLENYERIVSIYKKIFEKYKVEYIYEYIDFQKYNVYIYEPKDVMINTIKSYYCNAENLKKDLDIYERAACLAIAIKDNPCFIVSEKIGIINYTLINSFFALDVALKFCENELNKELETDELLNVDEIMYTKKLLIDIIENKNVKPSDIVDSLKLQVEFMNNHKVYKKIKDNN